MGDLKLFQINNGNVIELHGKALALEKSLQVLIEQNMGTIFGVTFIASEHSTGKKHGGRIDSLGLDENGSPVIFEYKRSVNENVINQGLFYLDWLMDHRAEFELLVMKKLGPEVAKKIDWTGPRLVCVATDFNRYDEHAIGQMNRSIELVRYRDYAGTFITFDLMASTSATATAAGAEVGPELVPKLSPKASPDKTVSQLHAQAPEDLRALYDALEAYLLTLGDDVTKTVRQLYYAFRRIKNFACVEVHPQAKKILVYVKADLETLSPSVGFTRDVTKIGHFGTGNLEITLISVSDLERAQPILLASYEAS